MSVPDDVSKSNSALAETIVSSFTSFLREDEDEDECPINTNVVDSIKAALDARFSNIFRCFENLNADTDKLQSPDPIDFSPSISHVSDDVFFEEAVPLNIKPVVFEAASFCYVEVAGGVFVSPTVSVFNDSHHVSFNRPSFCLLDGKAKEKVGKPPLYLGIAIYFHIHVPVWAVAVTISRPTVHFILGLWPNAIT